MSGILIIGGGQAGFSAASTLRNCDYKGSITILCSEPILPYQRPPLSKKFLLGEIPRQRLFFRPESYYTDNCIDVQLGVSAVKIDRDSSEVVLSNLKKLKYQKLILATGSTPNTIPEKLGGALKGVFCLRSINDVEHISHSLSSGERVLIIGGGYIGLEIASVLRKKKLTVTCIEAENRILKRVACLGTAKFFKKLHESQNVNILEGLSIKTLEGENGQFVGGILSNGQKIAADIAIVGIGVRPNIELARNCGLEIDNGIKVNEYSQTSDPKIFAAGDCTSFPYNYTRVRLESVGHAIDQGQNAAQSALGFRKQYLAKPWFWSDQYETKLQIAGLSKCYDDVIERSSGDALSFWYFYQNTLVAVDAINDGRSYMIAKKLLEKSVSPKKEILLNDNYDLKDLLGGS